LKQRGAACHTATPIAHDVIGCALHGARRSFSQSLFLLMVLSVIGLKMQ